MIDLCGSPPPRADSPKRRKERGSPELGGPERGWDVHREKGERWRKRQRLGAPRVPLGRTVVELSDDDDDEDDDKKLASRRELLLQQAIEQLLELVEDAVEVKVACAARRGRSVAAT